jgi:RHS repeat-associated protein
VQLRNYTQKYFYDAVGNLLTLQHIAGIGSYTRNYQYNAGNNQLTQTDTGGPVYAYTYNEHGSMLTLPQLSAAITWNCREEMLQAPLGGGGNAWYLYDCKGQRVRKVIEKAGNLVQERIYLGPFEIYRESQNGTITLERETLHVMDDQQRIAMVDTRTKGDDGTVAQLIRYQYGNHLGTACLELDDAAKIISYEEFHPFGTTAYQATDASRQVPAKRYRYTGMERDEETGLNYHTARYYIPWLGRWAAADPIGIGDGVNIYAYVSNNPIRSKDTAGTQGDATQQPVQITHPHASDPQPRFPEAGVPNPQPDGVQRAVPPPGHGAEVTADIATPDFHLAGRTNFHIIIGQSADDNPALSPFHLHGTFKLRYPGMPSAVPLDPRIEGDITYNGSTISSAALPPLPDPTVALGNFRGHFQLRGDLRGAPLVTGHFSLAGDVEGGDGPTHLTFDARVGVIADTPLLPFVRFTGTGTALGSSITGSGSFYGWGPGVTWGNWNYSNRSGFDVRGNYIGVQFGPLGLGSLDLHPDVPTSPDDPVPNLPPIGGSGPLAGRGAVDVFSPGTSVGYTRFYVNPNTRRYLIFSAGVSINPHIERQDLSRPSPFIFDLPGASHLEDFLNYHPNVGDDRSVPFYIGVSLSGTLP